MPNLFSSTACAGELFSMLARSRGRLRTWSRRTDAQKLPWAATRFGGLEVAVTSLGPGWVFDAFAREQRTEEYAQLQRRAAAD